MSTGHGGGWVLTVVLYLLLKYLLIQFKLLSPKRFYNSHMTCSFVLFFFQLIRCQTLVLGLSTDKHSEVFSIWRKVYHKALLSHMLISQHLQNVLTRALTSMVHVGNLLSCIVPRGNQKTRWTLEAFPDWKLWNASLTQRLCGTRKRLFGASDTVASDLEVH